MTRDVVGYRVLFLLIAMAFIFLNLLPLGPPARLLPAPDLLLGLTLCWTLRRPDYVPLGLVAVVFFMADVLTMRPLGLWTIIVIAATEYLRRHVEQREALSISAETLQIASVLAAAFVAERAVLTLLLAERPPLFGHFGHLLTTAMFYPAIVIVSQLLLGVRRLMPGEVDTLGSRV